MCVRPIPGRPRGIALKLLAFAPAGDEEQAVVDCQTETDGGGKVERERRHVGHPGQQVEAEHRDRDGDRAGEQELARPH